jgi:hypothetical protein
MQDLNSRLGTHDWTVGDTYAWAKALADFQHFGNKILGAKSEYARGLNAAKAFSAFSNNTMEEIAAHLRETGSDDLADILEDPTKFMKLAKSIKAAMESDNPEGAKVIMRQAGKPRWDDWLTAIHMNGMLFSLGTQVKAPVDMGKGLIREGLEKYLAVPIGMARRGVMGALGQNPKLGVSPAEALAHTAALLQSTADLSIYKAAIQSFKTGEGSFVTKDSMGQSVTQPSNNNMAQQMGQNTVRVPILSKATDAISAHDTFFRSVGLNTQLRALGTRRAAQEMPNASLHDQMALGESYAFNPDEAMMKEAMDLTNRTLLLNRNMLNGPIDWAKTKGGRVGRFIVQNIVPFARVEMNDLMSRIIQRSPLFFLDKFARAELMAGGARADIAMSKIALGSAALVLGFMAGQWLVSSLCL